MRKYILHRFLSLIPIFFAVTFLSFLLISLAPGDYLSRIKLDPGVSPEQIEKLRKEFGLDKPWYVQYGYWLYRLSPYEYPYGVKWPDFGYSFSNRVPVLTLMGQRFWNTLLLSATAEILIWIIAIPLALFLVKRRNNRIESVFSGFLLLGISIPQILLALIGLLIAARTGWFPVGGMHSIQSESLPFWPRIADLLHHMFVPALILAFTEVAVLVRYARSSLFETLDSEFVRTARAKGLNEQRLLRKHALPNAFNPLLTMLGLSIAHLLSASFVVEIIMGWPGLGRLTFDAMLSEDLYLLMASLNAATFLLVIGNLLADILLAVNDPRIRYA